MNLYAYVGKDMKGKVIKGKMKAVDKSTLIASFRHQEIWIYQIKKIGTPNNRILHFSTAMKPKEIAAFSGELATMIRSGVTIVQSLEIISQQTKKRSLHQKIKQILVQLEQGNTLAHSIEEQKIFPSFAIAMVQAGEASGMLDVVLENISKYYEKQCKIINKLKVSMTYPIIVSITAIAMLTALFTFVFPTIMDLFEGMNLDLPILTTYMLKVSRWFQHIWQWLLLLPVLLFIGTKCCYYTMQGSKLIDYMKLKLPLLGPIYLKIILLQFTTTLSLLLHSGLSLITSLEMTTQVLNNSYIESHIEEIIIKLREGHSFSTQAMRAKIFPLKLISMTQIGEYTGDFESAMAKAAILYEQETEMSITQILAIFEPALILLMAIIIGIIVLSVIQPMMELLNGVEHI